MLAVAWCPLKRIFTLLRKRTLYSSASPCTRTVRIILRQRFVISASRRCFGQPNGIYLFIFLFIFLLSISLHAQRTSIRAWFIVAILAVDEKIILIFLSAPDHPDKKCLDTVDGKPLETIYYIILDSAVLSSPETNIAWLRLMRYILYTK